MSAAASRESFLSNTTLLPKAQTLIHKVREKETKQETETRRVMLVCVVFVCMRVCVYTCVCIPESDCLRFSCGVHLQGGKT